MGKQGKKSKIESQPKDLGFKVIDGVLCRPTIIFPFWKLSARLNAAMGAGKGLWEPDASLFIDRWYETSTRY